MSLGFAVIGAGRIGQLHARHLAWSVGGAHLACVMDADPEAARRAAYAGADALDDFEAALAHPRVDAVVIASPTGFHAEQIGAAARAGKSVFCEKPVALTVKETVAALRAVEEAGVPFQIGFNRRFDPGYAEVARAVKAGEIGKVELFRSQSSDPPPVATEYLATSAGYYRDSVIHDIDTARFVVGEIERVTTLGRVLVDPAFAEYDDVDTSVVTLEFATGALGVLLNSRRTVHGYDLRVEVHGERGKLVTEDERATKVWRYDAKGIHGDYYYYFLERFKDAYRIELQGFVDAVLAEQTPMPGAVAAIESLRVAEAAILSLKEGRPVDVAEIRG